jgi:hypothetical protein
MPVERGRDGAIAPFSVCKCLTDQVTLLTPTAVKQQPSFFPFSAVLIALCPELLGWVKPGSAAYANKTPGSCKENI